MRDRDWVHVGMEVRSNDGSKMGVVRSIEGDTFEIQGDIYDRGRYLARPEDVDGVDIDRDEMVLAIDDDELRSRTHSRLNAPR